MSNRDKLHTGGLYLPDDPAIEVEQKRYLDRLYDFNQTRPSEPEQQQKILHELFADMGPNCYVEPPLHANFGGHHVHFGAAIYANFNLTLVDDTHIYVGDHTMIGPNVTLAILSIPSCGPKTISTIWPFTLARIAGWVPASLWSPVSRLAITWL